MVAPDARNRGGRPRTRPRGWVRLEVLVPPEAAAALREAARANRGGHAAFWGRLAMAGLRMAREAQRLDI